jgi:hypothetical protein
MISRALNLRPAMIRYNVFFSSEGTSLQAATFDSGYMTFCALCGRGRAFSCAESDCLYYGVLSVSLLLSWLYEWGLLILAAKLSVTNSAYIHCA